MTEMIMMCGIPGSGKTTYAERLAKEKNCIVHSSDKIREELGDVNDQSKNVEVFEVLHKRIKNDLQDGKSVIYDATNLNRKRRVAFLKELKNIPCRKICVLAATPWEYCLAQNFARERHVPEDVMVRMYKNFQMPCVYEGFDEIVVHYEKEEWKSCYGGVMEYVRSLCDFSQDNSHHTASLGDHMLLTGDHILCLNRRVYNNIVLAAFTHDIGKPDTKSFVNSKGEVTNEAHYYSHHNVGAYKSLFCTYQNDIDKQYVALLIELHMRPYMEWKQSDKAKEKDLQLFGKDVIDDVELLHEADKAAH